MEDIAEGIYEWAGAGEHVVVQEKDWEALSELVRSLPDEYRQKFKDLEMDILPIIFRSDIELYAFHK